MKKAIFMILWAAVFFVATIIIGSLALLLLCQMAGWVFPNMPTGVAAVWALIFFGSPFVALGLGARGVLPGTKKFIQCANSGCDAHYHPGALACPKCGVKTRVGRDRTLPCKTCKTPLIVRNHAQRTAGTIMVAGTGHTSSSVDYRRAPCPQCGDPAPLKHLSICYGPLVAFLAAVASFFWAFHSLTDTYEQEKLVEIPYLPTCFGCLFGCLWLFLTVRKFILIR